MLFEVWFLWGKRTIEVNLLTSFIQSCEDDSIAWIEVVQQVLNFRAMPEVKLQRKNATEDTLLEMQGSIESLCQVYISKVRSSSGKKVNFLDLFGLKPRFLELQFCLDIGKSRKGAANQDYNLQHQVLLEIEGLYLSIKDTLCRNVITYCPQVGSRCHQLHC